MRVIIALLLVAFCAFLSGQASAASLRLLAAHDASCGDFARWQSEVGPSYAATAEGRVAPLLSVNMQGPWPDGLALDSRPRQTPTFILIRDGQEIGRIEGYGEKERFFSQLSDLLRKDGSLTR